MIFDLVIRGGRIITAEGDFLADVGIEGEKISALGDGLKGKRIINAVDKLVLPGAIDPHVHLEMPVGDTFSSDDWGSGTKAAACGGVTTVIDFVEPDTGEDLLAALQKRQACADGRTAIDYGLHMTLRDDHEQTLKQVPMAVAAGCLSFKTYLTYEGFALKDEAFLHVLEAVRDVKGMVMVHAESDAIITYCTRQVISQGKTAPNAHPLARPAVAEAEAIQRALWLAEVTGTPIYFVHISTAYGAQALEHARRRGMVAYGETCPQYLILADDCYFRPGFEGAKFVCSPPLRKQKDQEALWKGLSNGSIQTVGTDHCPFNFQGQKDLGRDSFIHIPPGLPGIETRLALLYSFGVRTRRLSLSRWVECCALNPARLFGLYPRKGTLQPSADADIVIFDPHIELVISHKNLHERVDYTPYEGLPLQGYPEMTILRGTPIVEYGEYIASTAQGQFLHRRGTG